MQIIKDYKIIDLGQRKDAAKLEEKEEKKK